MASEHISNINDSTFDAEVLKSQQPVLIDFWAPWCAPCRAIAPIVEQLAGEYAGRIKVVKFNVDESQKVPTEYQVLHIPTLLVFKAGKVIGQIVGSVKKAQLDELVKKAL